MWIILSIIGLFFLLPKRRRQPANRPISKKKLLLFVVVFTALMCKAQNNTAIISGEILSTGNDKGKIIVFLVNEQSFGTPQTGIDTIILEPTGDVVFFEFDSCEKGEYGIRCYHDINNNGMLDKGLLGPKEPYGFSWKSTRKYPFSFSDISFLVSNNKYISIKLED